MRTGMMIACVGTIAWNGAFAFGGEAVTKAKVGEVAPAFSLKDVDGKEHKLSDYAGKIVVLEWSNYQCPFCRRHAEMRTAEKVMAKFEGKPVVWIGIDSTKTCEKNVAKIKKWMAKSKMAYPMLLDAPGSVGKLYGAKSTPHMFVVDAKGVLAYRGAMDDDPYGGGKKVKNYVESAVVALLKGDPVAVPMTKAYGCSVKYRE